jgi:hypothetical protein
MKRMFQILLALIFGTIAGTINAYTIDEFWGSIVGGIIAGGLTVATSSMIYDFLFVHADKDQLQKSVLQEMGED